VYYFKESGLIWCVWNL